MTFATGSLVRAHGLRMPRRLAPRRGAAPREPMRVITAGGSALPYAHPAGASGHSPYRPWLETVINADQAHGVSELILSGFLRVVTHSRVFDPASDRAAALAFTDPLRRQPKAVSIAPGPRHSDIFTGLCRAAAVNSILVPHACLAALAIESGSEWITTDRDFSRFPGLKWRHPLDA